MLKSHQCISGVQQLKQSDALQVQDNITKAKHPCGECRHGQNGAVAQGLNRCNNVSVESVDLYGVLSKDWLWRSLPERGRLVLLVLLFPDQA